MPVIFHRFFAKQLCKRNRCYYAVSTYVCAAVSDEQSQRNGPLRISRKLTVFKSFGAVVLSMNNSVTRKSPVKILTVLQFSAECSRRQKCPSRLVDKPCGDNSRGTGEVERRSSDNDELGEILAGQHELRFVGDEH